MAWKRTFQEMHLSGFGWPESLQAPDRAGDCRGSIAGDTSSGCRRSRNRGHPGAGLEEPNGSLRVSLEQSLGHRPSAGMEETKGRSTTGEGFWTEKAMRWRAWYQAERQRILTTKVYQERLTLLRDLHGRYAIEESSRINELENSGARTSYPMLKDGSLNIQELVERFPTDAQPKGSSQEDFLYYYHGTSAGIAVLAVQRGFLGGVEKLSDFLGVEKNEDAAAEAGIHFFDPEDFSANGNLNPLRLVASCIQFSDRMTWSARGILAYYAFRMEWEKSGAQGDFPPLDYFFKRAVVRVPKKNIPNPKRPPLGSVIGAPFNEIILGGPGSIEGAEVLLDENIPLPKIPVDIAVGIARLNDAESSIDLIYDAETIDSDWVSWHRQWDNWRVETEILTARRNALGNSLMQSWKPIQQVFGLKSDSSVAQSGGLEEKLHPAGMEETVLDVLPGRGVREIIEQQGGMVPGAAHQMAGRLYANRPEVQKALQANGGRIRLSAEIAASLSGQSDALGALLVSGSATDLPMEDFMVIADSDLSNPAAQRVLAWVPGGSDSGQVAKTLGLLKAESHQMALFEEEPGLTSERIQTLVAENLVGSPAPRSIVGTQEQVSTLPIAAFKVLGSMKGLPDVVFLGGAVTFKDQFDQEYSLIVWTQA